MTKVINVRGTNGSGKTYLVRKWMEHVGALPYPRRADLFGGTTLCGPVQYYVLKDGGVVLGSYENKCGGCDVLKSFEAIEKLLRQRLADKPPYLIFEGVIVSHIYGYWQRVSQSIGGMTWVFLDTPLDECLKRVYARNKGKQINEDYVKEKHRAIHNIEVKARNDGENVVVLPWKTAYTKFSKLVRTV